jgi:hypothetical protein
LKKTIILYFFSDFIPSSDGLILNVTGFCFKLTNYLESSLNFSTKFVPSKDSSYGVFTNGSWNGMIGELIGKRADFSPLLYSVDSHRQQSIDLIQLPSSQQPKIYYIQGNSEYPNWTVFLAVFDSTFWLVVFVCMFVFACFLLVFIKVGSIDEIHIGRLVKHSQSKYWF